jgi:hypothetical protein
MRNVFCVYWSKKELCLWCMLMIVTLPWNSSSNALPLTNALFALQLVHNSACGRIASLFIFQWSANWVDFNQWKIILKNNKKIFNKNTNKTQLCNIIYYSKVFWKLNMFRVAHRPSSGALNCISPLSIGNGRSPHGYINQRLQIQFRAPDNERNAARNVLSLQ